MKKTQRSTALYPHPFCKAYWRDAAAEMKDQRMLTIAALVVALRVALKILIQIPLAANLKITPAFLVNALGAMIYGPVVGAFSAVISDLLEVMLAGYEYFPLYALMEIASAMIFAMFFYRQRVTTLRVVLSRFLICLGVNILMQTPIDILYYSLKGNSTTVAQLLTLPRIFKNLFMFPIESVVLTVFLSAIQPVTYRMGLTFHPATKLHFERKQIAALVLLFAIGCASVVGYLFVHYDNTSLTTGYSAQEVVTQNQRLHEIVVENTDGIDSSRTIAVIEYARKPFLGKEITYTVAIYQVAEGYEVTDEMWSLKKSAAKARIGTDLVLLANATVVTDTDTETVISYDLAFVQ